MIFVTVGTHEQPFNRVVQYIDELKANGTIQEDVIVQTGYSTYKPKYCKWKSLFPYKDMIQNVYDARVVITHGGPASFIMPLQIGKIPVVVPRQYKFGEHINNHQVEFTKAVAERMGNIVLILNIEDLKDVLLNYDKIINLMSSEIENNNRKFNEELEKIAAELLTKKTCG